MHEDEAMEFLEVMGRHYAEYLGLFTDKGVATADEVDEMVLRCHRAILNGGIRDRSEQGYKNYFFMSVNLNKRQGWGRLDDARVADVGTTPPAVDSDGTPDRMWWNDLTVMSMADGDDDSDDKLRNELYASFAVHYLHDAAERAFEDRPMSFYCWRLKHIADMTHREVAATTGIRSSDRLTREVDRWLRRNVTKKEVDEAFQRKYPEFGSL